MTSGMSTPVLRSPDQAVHDVITAIGADWAAGDAEAFATRYAPDATVALPGGVFLQGRSHIQTHSAAGFAGALRGSATVNNDISVRMIGDGVAVAVASAGSGWPARPRSPGTGCGAPPGCCPIATEPG